VSDAALEQGITSIPGVNINVDVIDKIGFIFFLSVVVHAIGDGLLAGVIQKGSLAIGMRHSFIMLLMGFIVLRFMFGGS
jgi:GTP-sensing pleiotropic transcriptional regulator CodY